MALSDDRRERLSAYLDDEITPQERAEIDAWLASDPSARSELESLRGVSRAIGNLPRVTAGPELADRVISQFEREALLARQEAPRSFPGKGWLAGLAAAAVLMLAVTIALRSRVRVAEPAGERPVLTVADAGDSQPVATDAHKMVSPSVSEESDEMAQLRARFDSGAQPSDQVVVATPNAESMAPWQRSMSKSAPGAGGQAGGDDSTLSYAYAHQRGLGEAAIERSSHDEEAAPAIRAMARAEDRDEILFRLYQFVEASPSAEFVETEISELALLIPGLDWLFLGLPVGGAAGSGDRIEISLNESDVPELLAVLQPIPGTRYELRAAEVSDAPVAAGRVVARRSQTPQASGSVREADSRMPPAATAASKNPSRELKAASQPAAEGNLFGAPRRVRVVIAFPTGANAGMPADGASSTTQPAGARP
ncbi:hypothetical protein RAS2_18840 [Phycisphaerae bacterium RAS2]|nr:hypothetical protein RAS2_18840 [Phycisphaerae bacterium RAS2]